MDCLDLFPDHRWMLNTASKPSCLWTMSVDVIVGQEMFGHASCQYLNWEMLWEPFSFGIKVIRALDHADRIDCDFQAVFISLHNSFSTMGQFFCRVGHLVQVLMKILFTKPPASSGLWSIELGWRFWKRQVPWWAKGDISVAVSQVLSRGRQLHRFLLQQVLCLVHVCTWKKETCMPLLFLTPLLLNPFCSPQVGSKLVPESFQALPFLFSLPVWGSPFRLEVYFPWIFHFS